MARPAATPWSGSPTNRRRGKARPVHEDPAPADAIFVVYCDNDPHVDLIQGRDQALAIATRRATRRRELGLQSLTCGFMLESKWRETPHPIKQEEPDGFEAGA